MEEGCGLKQLIGDKTVIKIRHRNYELLLDDLMPRWFFIEEIIAEGKTIQELLDSAILKTSQGSQIKIIDLNIPMAKFFFDMILDEMNGA